MRVVPGPDAGFVSVEQPEWVPDAWDELATAFDL